ncbi:uncharacterized protein LOC130791945 isoform X5 [Actinidia eriantha]|uniref:uncharacterized protein LOC130791945 isoform X5 n=1 Tax=Actinidia eriantha TaxID=165200 RepID=UPI00258F0B51|nr:uncharacterized protein LOC130791945 isoform X5 [Actinidia eriantha]
MGPFLRHRKQFKLARKRYSDPLNFQAMGMSEFCVAVPGFSKLSSSHCSDEAFSEYVKRRDPLKLGFADPLLLQLVRQLSAVDLIDSNFRGIYLIRLKPSYKQGNSIVPLTCKCQPTS